MGAPLDIRGEAGVSGAVLLVLLVRVELLPDPALALSSPSPAHVDLLLRQPADRALDHIAIERRPWWVLP